MLKFGEYLPDLPDFQNPGITEAKNVIPSGMSYKSFPDLSAYSDALTSRCQGATSALANDGTAYNFSGDATKLYSLSSASWADVSIATGYTTSANEVWQFTQFGQDIIATNYANNPQYYTMGTSTLFADLTSALKCRYIGVVRDFVVAGNTFDATDGAVPNRVRWCAQGDPMTWTVSATTQADYQDLDSSKGWVKQVIGGEYGVIFQERAITRMSYEGSPTVFRFDQVEANRGTQCPNSVVKIGNLIAYLGEDGFYIFDGYKSVSIGSNKIDKTFYSDFDQSYTERVYAALDPINKLIFWSYVSVNAVGGVPDKVLIYNYSPDAATRWAYGEITTEVLCRGLSEGYTLEGLDALYSSIESVPFSLDSRIWSGGAIYLAAFNSIHQLCTLTGSALTSVLETTEAEISAGRRTRLNKLRPIVDGSGTITMQVGERNLLSDTVSWQPTATVDSTGNCSVRSNARYQRARVTINGGFNNAQGLDIVQANAGGKR